MITRAETLPVRPMIWLDDMGRVVVYASYVPTGQLFLGADVGRRKALTALSPVEKLFNGRHIVRGILRLRNMPFAGQRPSPQRRCRTTRYRPQVVPGRQWPGHADGGGADHTLWQQPGRGHHLQPACKGRLGCARPPRVRGSSIDMPEDRLLRSAIHAVRRIPTASGHFRFDADRTDAGHADEFWALALVLHAADGRIISNDFVAPALPSTSSLAGGYL